MTKLYYTMIEKPIWRVYDNKWRMISECDTEEEANQYCYEIDAPTSYHIVEEAIEVEVLDTPHGDYD